MKSQAKKVGLEFAFENINMFCCPQVFRKAVLETRTIVIKECLTVDFCSDFWYN